MISPRVPWVFWWQAQCAALNCFLVSQGLRRAAFRVPVKRVFLLVCQSLCSENAQSTSYDGQRGCASHLPPSLAVVPQRAGGAERSPGSADGSTQLHHGLVEVSRSPRVHSCVGQRPARREGGREGGGWEGGREGGREEGGREGEREEGGREGEREEGGREGERGEWGREGGGREAGTMVLILHHL